MLFFILQVKFEIISQFLFKFPLQRYAVSKISFWNLIEAFHSAEFSYKKIRSWAFFCSKRMGCMVFFYWTKTFQYLLAWLTITLYSKWYEIIVAINGFYKIEFESMEIFFGPKKSNFWIILLIKCLTYKDNQFPVGKMTRMK